MEINWNHLQQIKRIEERVNKLGFVMTNSRYNYSGEYTIGLYPLDDNYPLYCRDFEIFTGTLDMIASWIRGFESQRDYLFMLKATSEKKIKKLEDNYIKINAQKAMLDKINDPDHEFNSHTEDLIKLHNK